MIVTEGRKEDKWWRDWNEGRNNERIDRLPRHQSEFSVSRYTFFIVNHIVNVEKEGMCLGQHKNCFLPHCLSCLPFLFSLIVKCSSCHSALQSKCALHSSLSLLLQWVLFIYFMQWEMALVCHFNLQPKITNKAQWLAFQHDFPFH